MIALGSMNEERGTDSVGIAYISNNAVRVIKIAERPCVGLNITMRKEVTEAAISGMFIGHTRQATQGSVSSRNAHPFLDDGIAFAHNGIISNDETFGKYEVDSESLIHGIKDKDFSKYEGAIALIWIENGKLHAFRYGNPLYRGRHNGSTYLASEGEYLKDVGCTGVKELSEGLIYTFNSAFDITTKRVNKNKLFGHTYGLGAKGFHNDTYMSGMGWDDYIEKVYDNERTDKNLLLPTKTEEIKEDFRTPNDIAKTYPCSPVDHCEVCGNVMELSEGGMCLDCITWLGSQGLICDNPPAWLKVH